MFVSRLIRPLVAIATVVSLSASLSLLSAEPQPAYAAKVYKVAFKANGGHGAMAYQAIPTSGRFLSRVRFARQGFRFAGWAISAKSKPVLKDHAFFKPKRNLVLYAIWVSSLAKPKIDQHSIGNLLWSDEFIGTAGGAVNDAFWTTRLCGHEATNGGGTCHNNEPQWYTPDAVSLDGSAQGNAVITTTRVWAPPANAGLCLADVCNYTSGRFDTQGKVSFKYGYLEARIKMPTGGANWPAFWALGDSISAVGWPLSGEIDIAEEGGNRPTRASSAVHYSSDNIPDCCNNHLYEVDDLVDLANYQSDFHTYGMAWLPDRMEFYVDGDLFWIVTPSTLRSNVWSFNDPFFLILNNATGPFGGDYTGWAQSFMTIDYVRAWQLDGQGQVIKN